jgi:hypothetical protein
MASIAASGNPAAAAARAWTHHSTWLVQRRPVTMMASSFSRFGSEVPKRRISPSADQRSARAGLWMTARSGPTTVPRGPATTAS